MCRYVEVLEGVFDAMCAYSWWAFGAWLVRGHIPLESCFLVSTICTWKCSERYLSLCIMYTSTLWIIESNKRQYTPTLLAIDFASLVSYSVVKKKTKKATTAQDPPFPFIRPASSRLVLPFSTQKRQEPCERKKKKNCRFDFSNATSKDPISPR